MKKIITLISFLALVTAAQAEDFSLYYDATDGSSKQLGAVADLQKIVFGEGTMTIVKKDGTQVTTERSLVKRLYFFAGDPTAIQAVSTDGQQQQGNEIHDLTGRKMNVNDVNELPKGIYIVGGKKVNIK